MFIGRRDRQANFGRGAIKLEQVADGACVAKSEYQLGAQRQPQCD
jgi:hypothetical protein